MTSHRTINLVSICITSMCCFSPPLAIAQVDECEEKGWLTFVDVKRNEDSREHISTEYPFGYGNVPGVSYLLPRDTTVRRAMIQAGQVASVFIREGVLGALGATHEKLSRAMSSLDFKYIQAFDAVNPGTRTVVTPLSRIDFRITFSYDDLPALYLQKDAIMTLRRTTPQSSFQVSDFREANIVTKNKLLKLTNGAHLAEIASKPLFWKNGPQIRALSPKIESQRMQENLISASKAAFASVTLILKGKFRQRNDGDLAHGTDDINLVVNSALYDDDDASKRLHTVRFSTIFPVKDETHRSIFYDADLAIVWDPASNAYAERSLLMQRRAQE